MGNSSSRSVPSESINPPPHPQTSPPPSPPPMVHSQSSPLHSVNLSPPTDAIASVSEDPDEHIRPSKRFKSSESTNPHHHISTPSPPPTMESSHSPPPMVAVESIREMCRKTDPVKQIDPLVTFIENQLQKMNTLPSEAGSSSSYGWLEAVTGLAAKTIKTIYSEAEKLSDSDEVKAIGNITLEIMNGVEDLHCVLIGLSVAAYAVVRYRSVGRTDEEWRELLFKIIELSKHVKQYSEQMPERERLCNAVRTIVECAIIFCDYLKIGESSRFWSSTTAAALLDKTKQQLRKDYGEGQDAFLSHSGKQKNFVRQLFEDLNREHVSCFFDEDDNSLPIGEKFPPLIFKAAETCKTAVVVLSKEFIESKWPMLELSAFISAKEEGKNVKLKLIPIFFKIKPKELSGFTEDCEEWKNLKVSDDTRRKWQHALHKVHSINGVEFTEGGNEVDCRKKVVKKIRSFLRGINPPKLLDFQPVGIEERVQKVKALLDIYGPESALAVVVYGLGGIGKSTIAASVVQSLDWYSTDFKFCSVAIDDNTQNKTSHIIELQKYIINMLGGVKRNFQNPSVGRDEIKKALERKFSFLFIDNVVDKDYIRQLLPQDLQSGEQETKLRMIITSRDINVKAELNNIICKEYEVEHLSDVDSKKLLEDTIGQGQMIEEGEKLKINEVAAACKGFPLLLSTFGKHLRVERGTENYEEVLHVLKGDVDVFRDECLDERIMYVYDKIQDVETKEAFLDICVFFHGWEWNLVAYIVDVLKLKDLHRRSLVSKSGSDKVIVHDIVRLMGMKKAKHTRFLNYKEFSVALEDNLVDFRKVTGISLVNDTHLIPIQSKQLNDMRHSLRVLMLGDWVALDGSPCDTAFKKLKYLSVGDITAFPFKDLSKLENLTVFKNRSKSGMNLSLLPSSLKHISHEVPYLECNEFRELPLQNLNSLKSFSVKKHSPKSVELPQELQLPASLIELNLTTCKNLPKYIGHLTALESLVLDRIELECLPQGFAKIPKVKYLSIQSYSKLNCCSIQSSLFEDLGNFSCLEALCIEGNPLRSWDLRASVGTLSMEGWKNLKSLPESLVKLHIHKLDLKGLHSLQELPNSFGNMPLLKDLSLQCCGSLMSLPDSFDSLSSLEALSLSECPELKALPESFGKLRIHKLVLKGLKSLQGLPNSFGNMPLLKDLSLNFCGSLMSLPDSFDSLSSLEALSMRECPELKALPESFGKLRIHKLVLKGLMSLQEIPNSFGNMPLKDLRLESCGSLISLPDSFGNMPLKYLHLESCVSLISLPDSFMELRMLETLRIINCFKHSILPKDFGLLSYLKDMTMQSCPLKELPHGFGALPVLKTFTLSRCNVLLNLPTDFTELTTLEELHLVGMPWERIPNGFRMLKRLRLLFIEECLQLRGLSDDFENMATLEYLCIRECPELEGSMMEKILKLQNCSMADIEGSIKLLEKWKQMHTETEHPITVFSGDKQIDRDVEKRGLMEALLNGKFVEVDNSSRQLMERSSLLVGSEKGKSATVAVIILPRTKMLPFQYKMLQRYLEMASKRVKTNGWGKLQVVCARRYVWTFLSQPPTEGEETAEGDIHQILMSMPKGSCALSEPVKMLRNYDYSYDRYLVVFIGHVMVDTEGRESFESFEEDAEGREGIQSFSGADECVSFHEFIYYLLPDKQRESPCVAGESKTREFIQALKADGIHHLLIQGEQMMVDVLDGKTIGFIICELRFLELLRLTQVLEDLDSNFIAIFIPIEIAIDVVEQPYGHGSCTRISQCMPLATIPHPQAYDPFSLNNPCFVVIDNEGHVANKDALPLLMGWGSKFYPFTPHSIHEGFFTMESDSVWEILFHGMNIAGRKPMKGKMTFLYAASASEGLELKCELEQFTQIHTDFEVLYVGKLYLGFLEVEDANIAKQEYEAATQNMCWPSLSFSEWITFWSRCTYFESYEHVYRGSNEMMDRVLCLVRHLRRNGFDTLPSLVLVDSDEIVTFYGERVLQRIRGPYNDISNGETLAKLIASFSSGGGCSLLQFVKKWFRDRMANHPKHPEHRLTCKMREHRYVCAVCMKILDYYQWSYDCTQCRWRICESCHWVACAEQHAEDEMCELSLGISHPQQAEQLERTKPHFEVEQPAAEDDICKLTL